MTTVANDTQREFAAVVRSFVVALGSDRPAEAKPFPFDLDRWRALSKLGGLLTLVPADAGGFFGSGGGAADLVVMAEELGSGLAGAPFVPLAVAVAAIVDSPNIGLRNQLLARIVDDSAIVGWHRRLPGERTSSTQLTARWSGDYVYLNGVIDGIDDLPEAIGVLVSVTTDDSGIGVAQLFVPTDVRGFSVMPQPALDLSRRFYRAQFQEVKLDRTHVLHPHGLPAMERQLGLALLLQSADTVGATRHVFEATMEYARDRYAFGRPLASFQVIKHRFADMMVFVETAAGMVLESASRHDHRDSALAAAVATKLYVAERAVELVQSCVQIYGGVGVTWEHETHHYLRRVTTNMALCGTPSDHRRWLGAEMENRYG